MHEDQVVTRVYGLRTNSSQTSENSIPYGQNIRPLVRRLTRHSGSLQKNRLIALERAAAVDVEYEFADGSSSPANATIVGVGVGPDVAYRARSELRADSRRVLMVIAQEPT